MCTAFHWPFSLWRAQSGGEIRISIPRAPQIGGENRIYRISNAPPAHIGGESTNAGG